MTRSDPHFYFFSTCHIVLLSCQYLTVNYLANMIIASLALSLQMGMVAKIALPSGADPRSDCKETCSLILDNHIPRLLYDFKL